MVGANVDRSACDDITRRLPKTGTRINRLIDFCGKSDLPTLAGILGEAHAVVSNDSGAMHLAGAVGTKVVAVFGPTRERKPRRCRQGRCAGARRDHARRVLPALYAARVPDRSSLHAAHHRPRGACRPFEMKRAIFLDRDGTLNVDVGYLHRLEDLELFPWTTDALRLLKRAGYHADRRHQSVGHRARVDRSGLRPDLPRRDAPAAAGRRRRSRRVVLLPASSARLGEGIQRRLPLPQAAARHGGRCGPRSRHRSETVVGDRRQVARRESRSCRRREIDPGAHRLGRGAGTAASRLASRSTRCATT